jgi:hypothetical protein
MHWTRGHFPIAMTDGSHYEVHGLQWERWGVRELVLELAVAGSARVIDVNLWQLTHLPSGRKLCYAAEELRDAQLICEIADRCAPKSPTAIDQLTLAQREVLKKSMTEALDRAGFRVAEIPRGPAVPDLILHKVDGKPRSRKLLEAAARAWFARGRHWSDNEEYQAEASQRFCEAYPSLTKSREASIRKLLDRAFEKLCIETA